MALKATARKATGYQARPYLRLVPRPTATDNNQIRLYMPDGTVTLDASVTATPVRMALDEAATVTITVADPAGDLRTLALSDANEDRLLSGIDIRWRGVWWRIARIERGDHAWTITAEDRIAAYLRSHKREVTASRADTTRAGFVYQLAGGVKAGGGIRCYIPELRVKQAIYEPLEGTAAKKTKAKSSLAAATWGDAASKVKVKRTKADQTQLASINGCLIEAARLGATRRVMIAVVMCITQESVARPIRTGDKAGPDSRGLFQQRAPWGPEADRLDAAKSTRMFLTGGKGGQPGWKQRHGSVKSSGGNLASMITAVQVSVGGYSEWESEATKTVDLWLDRNQGVVGLPSSSDSGSEDTTYRGVYKFRTGGETGAANWWDATGDLADEVQWHRWAVSNTLGFATDDEMIRGNPVLWVSRERQEVQDMSWSWDQRRQASELTVTLALEDPFQLLPGMVAMVDDEAPVSGRWLVDSIDVDPLAGNIAEVSLRRRGAKLLEPAPEIKTKETSTSIGGKKTYGSASDSKEGAAAVYAEAVRISKLGLPYVWGGGHGKAGTPDGGTGRDSGIGYDCSGYTVACLVAAEWGFKKGGGTAVSGDFANWGLPGPGRELTVYWSATHVFIVFHGLGQYKRADTNFQIPEPRGPRVRKRDIDTSRYQARHWPGH